MLRKPIIASEMFEGLNIVEYVSVVECDECSAQVSNLVIAIGRKDLRSYHKFVTYRLQSDGRLDKIRDPSELPNWSLRGGEADFTLDEAFYGLFPEKMVTLYTNSSLVHGFVYLPWLKMFHLKFFINNTRYFYWRKLNEDKTLTDWDNGTIEGTVTSLNSSFYINRRIYTIDTNPQVFALISHEMHINERGGQMVFRITNIVSDRHSSLKYKLFCWLGYRGQAVLQLFRQTNITTTPIATSDSI